MCEPEVTRFGGKRADWVDERGCSETQHQSRCYDTRAMAERPSRDEIKRRVLEDKPSFVVPVDLPEKPIEPRDSATVVLVRDGADGLEVFMLERHLNSDFAGGAYVFP